MKVVDSIRHQLEGQFSIEVNERLEWVWWWARWLLAAAGLVGGSIVFAGTSQLTLVFVNSGAFLAANLGILWLLRRGTLRRALTAGFVIDSWVVIVNWWTVLQVPDKGEKPSDLYLILFPFFIAVVVRLGPVVGVAYAAVLIALMAAGDLYYQGAGSYAVSQLPTRVLFLVVTVGITALLVSRLKTGRVSLREAYSSLAVNEERFRKLFESAPVGIGMIDTNRRFIEVNQALGNLLGLGTEAFAGKRISDFEVDPTGRRAAGGFFSMLETGGANLVARERQLKRADGSEVWANVVSAAVRDEQGEFQYAIRIFEDVTERKQMAVAKDEFLAMTSHELKSPITSILATFKLLASGTMGAVPPEAEEMLVGAERNAERLSSLVKEILELQRLDLGADPMRMGHHDAAGIAENVVKMLAPTADAAGVWVTVVGQSPVVYCDDERIEQVLMNLVANAIKFSPEDAKVEIGLGKTDGGAMFSVRDEGRGIPMELHGKVFEKFWQADASDSREAGGTGLGLAIAKAIVESHRGRIWLESGDGDGSVFCFVLPD